MPSSGDMYEVVLKKAHIEWGTHRYTNTRGQIYGEGYIHIPNAVAKELEIYNSNKTATLIRYNCSSVDGFYSGVLLAQGSSKAGSVFAKQFAEDGNLKGIGSWYAHNNAQPGDRVRVTWINSEGIEIEHISNH